MKIAAAFVGGLLIGVFLGTLATKEKRPMVTVYRNHADWPNLPLPLTPGQKAALEHIGWVH